MVKGKDRETTSAAVRPQKALLFELKGEALSEEEGAAAVSTELFAALSMEEVLAYVRGRQPSVEVLELKVIGKLQVLSSSENLE